MSLYMSTTNPTNKRAGYPLHLRRRVQALQKRLLTWGADALLVINPKDIRYLTGFTGEDSWAVVGARSTRITIISDFRFEQQVQRQAPHVSAIMRKKSLTEEVSRLLGRRRLNKIALQAGYTTLVQRKALVRKLGARRLVDVDDGLLCQRAVKDKAELAAIRRALKIHQEAYRQTIAQIQPGQTEQQIAALLEYQMRQLGADSTSFPTIVAADGNASLPHAIPGARKVKSGSLILIDSGVCWGGYCSDLTRVVAIGRMKPKLREIYQVVLEAQQAAIAAIRPGESLKQIDAVARGVIDKSGYSHRFGHSLGHGIGLDIHEQPTLSSQSQGQLQAGHVVTVEPGVYVPGLGGVRIEDDVLVTDRGHRVLSDLPSDIESAII